MSRSPPNHPGALTDRHAAGAGAVAGPQDFDAFALQAHAFRGWLAHTQEARARRQHAVHGWLTALAFRERLLQAKGMAGLLTSALDARDTNAQAVLHRAAALQHRGLWALAAHVNTRRRARAQLKAALGPGGARSQRPSPRHI